MLDALHEPMRFGSDPDDTHRLVLGLMGWWRHFITEQKNLARIPGRLPRGTARGQLPGPRFRRPPFYAGRRNRVRPAAVSRAPAAIITSHGAGFAGGGGAVPPNPAETAPFGMI